MLSKKTIETLIALVDEEIAQMRIEDRDDAWRLLRLAHAHGELIVLAGAERPGQVAPHAPAAKRHLHSA